MSHNSTTPRFWSLCKPAVANRWSPKASASTFTHDVVCAVQIVLNPFGRKSEDAPSTLLLPFTRCARTMICRDSLPFTETDTSSSGDVKCLSIVQCLFSLNHFEKTAYNAAIITPSTLVKKPSSLKPIHFRLRFFAVAPVPEDFSPASPTHTRPSAQPAATAPREESARAVMKGGAEARPTAGGGADASKRLPLSPWDN